MREYHPFLSTAVLRVLVSYVQIDALTDHIEKLMTHLQHEAAAKAKAFEATKRAQRELQDLKGRNAALLKRNAERENLITELKVCRVVVVHFACILPIVAQLSRFPLCGCYHCILRAGIV